MSMSEKIIPVYDLCALHSDLDINQLHREIVGGAFADYISYRQQLLVSHGHTFYRGAIY